MIGSALFRKSSFLKYKCAIRSIYFFINYFSFLTSWKFTDYLNRSCCFDWVGFFCNIWTIPHSPLILFFSIFFTLYPVLAFCSFSFTVNKFSWNCLMNEKVLLITGATFSQSWSYILFINGAIFSRIILFMKKYCFYFNGTTMSRDF